MTPAKKHVKQSKKGITFLMMHQGKSTSPLLRKYVPIVTRVRPHRYKSTSPSFFCSLCMDKGNRLRKNVAGYIERFRVPATHFN